MILGIRVEGSIYLTHCYMTESVGTVPNVWAYYIRHDTFGTRDTLVSRS